MFDRLPPQSHTPLIALPVLVLDLETTGLDVRNDRVVQIGAIAMRGTHPVPGVEFDRLVNPGIPIPQASSRIHGLFDADVAGAPPLSEQFGALQELMVGRVVVGHNIAFDVAILRHEAARHGLAWHEPPVLDIGQLLGALEPSLPDLGMERVMAQLGVQLDGRHTAIGDCRAAAAAWARLLPMLRTADARTLGEARLLAASRDDFALRQAQAGWDAVPEGLPGMPAMQPGILELDSYAFESRIEHLMSSPAASIEPQASLREAARTMVERKIGSLLVGHGNGPAAGIITERDILRVAAAGTQDLDATRVDAVMTSPVASVSAHDLMYRALGRMDRLGIRHLCVVDHDGKPVGMVAQRDLLRHRTRSASVLGDHLAVAHDAPALAAAFARLPTVAVALLSEDLSGVDIARVISDELRELSGRASEIALEQMRARGRGEAPAPWCVMVLGSGGRGESLLAADQDNALIHAGTPADDPWFAEFGGIVADLIDAAGVPRCTGGVMASNAQWRGTPAVWEERVQAWVRRARPEDLLNVDIFFDLVPVAGEAGLAHDLHLDSVRIAASTRPFLGLLAQSVTGTAPRVGMFGRLRLVDGRVDLKRDGLLALVMIARTLALSVGSTSRATPERLRDAVDAVRMSAGEAEELIALQELLLTCVLRQQLRDLDEGIPISTRVPIRSLTRVERRQITHGLRTLETLAGEIRGTVASG